MIMSKGRGRVSGQHATSCMVQPPDPHGSWLVAQRLVDTQEQLQELYNLARAFQEGCEGLYMYGQASLDAGTSLPREAQAASNGLTLR